MKLFNRLFKKSISKEPIKPERIELIKGKLYVDIFEHKIEVDGPYQGKSGIAFLSEGLNKNGHKELFLVLVNNENKLDKVYEKINSFFKTVFEFSLKNTIVDIGQFTIFGRNDVFGWKGIVYTEPAAHLERLFKYPTLNLVLLNEAEVKSVQQYGYSRIMSMLGFLFRYFPYPYWSDLKRKSLEINRMEQNTTLNMVSIRLILMTSKSFLENEEIILQIDRNSDFKVTDELVNYSRKTPFMILNSLNLESNSCLTYDYEMAEKEPMVITAPNNDTSKINGCQLVIIGDQQEYSGRIVEDGFCIMISNAQLEEFWKSFITYENLTFKGQGNLNFKLEWK